MLQVVAMLQNQDDEERQMMLQIWWRCYRLPCSLQLTSCKSHMRLGMTGMHRPPQTAKGSPAIEPPQKPLLGIDPPVGVHGAVVGGTQSRCGAGQALPCRQLGPHGSSLSLSLQTHLHHAARASGKAALDGGIKVRAGQEAECLVLTRTAEHAPPAIYHPTIDYASTALSWMCSSNGHGLLLAQYPCLALTVDEHP